MLCRAVVLALQRTVLLGTIGRGELWQLARRLTQIRHRVSVVYADGVFILLALLPLHLRERALVPGQTAVLVLRERSTPCWSRPSNLVRHASTSVTRRNASRPTRYSSPTTSNSLQLAGKFMAENWYLVLLSARHSWRCWRGVTAAGRTRRAFSAAAGPTMPAARPSSPSRRG